MLVYAQAKSARVIPIWAHGLRLGGALIGTFTFKTISVEFTVACLNYFPNQRKQYRFKKKITENIPVLYLICSGSRHHLLTALSPRRGHMPAQSPKAH